MTIKSVKLVIFDKDALGTQEWGTWDDNGGPPDGDMWLLPLDEVDPFDGMTVVDGWEVTPYTEPSNYWSWCGFSSRNVAYTLDREAAEAIDSDEYCIAVGQGD